MPAPDYPRVPFPYSQEPFPPPIEGRWWYERPWPFWVVEGIDGMALSLRTLSKRVDAWPSSKVAEAIDKGLLHDGWPWELTRKGRAVLSSRGRG